jgi:hypothetical protein
MPKNIKKENLDLFTAIKKCLNDGYFFRAKEFEPGYYIKSEFNALMMVNGNIVPHKSIGLPAIYKNMLNFKYNIFLAANVYTLGIKPYPVVNK